MRQLTILFSLGLALMGSSLHAGGQAKDQSPFRFDGPEITKIDWNAHGLHSADFNKDGLADIVFINRERSRIEVHFRRKPGQLPKNVKPSRSNRWEPVLEDAPYVKENIPTSTQVVTLISGDFDGDQQLDLAYGSSDDGIFVHFREKDRFLKDPVEIETDHLRTYHGALLGKDMDGDGQTEILAHVKKGLQVIRFDKRSPQPNPKLYRDNSESSRGLYFADINDDGQEDWLYLSHGSEYGVRSRLRDENGFGPEFSHRFRSGGEILKLACGPKGYQQPTFVTVEAASRQVAIFEVSKKVKPPKLTRHLSPMVRNVFDTDKGLTSFVFEDFTGDGRPDIAAATSAEPSVQLFRGLANGNFSPVGTFPSLGDITQLAAGRFRSTEGTNQSATLVILSSEEKLVGLSSFENKRFHFPKAVSLEGEPVMVSCANLDSDAYDDLLIISKERYDYTLRRYTQDEQGKFSETLEIELDGFKRTPAGLLPCDLNCDGHLDLLVLSSRNPALILVGDGKGGLKEAAKDSAVRKSLLVGLTPHRVSMADIDGDQKEELLVAGTGYVRAVKMTGDEMEVVDQFNARSSKDEVLSPFTLNVAGDETPELLFFVPEGRMDVLSKAKDGVYRHLRSHEIAPFPLQHLKVLPSKGPKSTEILAFGKHTYRRIPLEPSKDLPKLQVHQRFESDIRDIKHKAVDTGDFNSDGRPDLLCIDPAKNLLEFFQLSDDGSEWQSVLHFRVFEKNLHVRGERRSQTEPREGLITDLNGDGKDDLLLLVHDRLLHYYQQ